MCANCKKQIEYRDALLAQGDQNYRDWPLLWGALAAAALVRQKRIELCPCPKPVTVAGERA